MPQDKQVTAFMQMKEYDTANRRQRRNVQYWFTQHPSAVTPDEQDYIDHSEDLISMSRSPKSSLQQLCERIAVLRWIFRTSSRKLPDFDKDLSVGSDRTMRW